MKRLSILWIALIAVAIIFGAVQFGFAGKETPAASHDCCAMGNMSGMSSGASCPMMAKPAAGAKPVAHEHGKNYPMHGQKAGTCPMGGKSGTMDHKGGACPMMGTAAKKSPGAAASVDPVCKMKIDAKRASGGKSVYKRKTYSFCSKACKQLFDKNPAKYAK